MLIDREALLSSKSNVIAPGLKLVLSEAWQGLVSIVSSLAYT